MPKPKKNGKQGFSPARILRYQILKVVRLKDDPHKVALGFALGVFIGFLPTIPIQTYMAVGLAFIFRGSAIAAAAAVWISNPLTLAAFYYADFVVGKWVVGSEVKFTMAEKFLHTLLNKAGDLMSLFEESEAIWQLLLNTWDAFWLMMIGGAIMGVPAAIIGYFGLYKIMESGRRRRELNRMLRKAQARAALENGNPDG